MCCVEREAGRAAMMKAGEGYDVGLVSLGLQTMFCRLYVGR